jgi:hypothetical protein
VSRFDAIEISPSTCAWHTFRLLTTAILATLLLAGAAGHTAAEEPAESLTEEKAISLVGEAVAEVEELRGLEFKRPVPVQVIDDDRAREHLIRRLESFQSKDDLKSVELAYKVLGLLPPDADILQSFLDALREQAGGFYDPPSGSFYLLEDIPEILAPAITVHELTHALEDQHFDLDSRLRGALEDDDLLFALASVHEGSASLLMAVSLTRQVLHGDLDAAALQAFAQSEAARAEVLTSMPPLLQRQLVGPYVLGSSFLMEGDFFALMATGYPAERVDRSFAKGPVSSEQILHPAKYWNEAGRDDPRQIRLGGAGRKLGKRWHKRYEGTLGELNLGVLVGAPTPDAFQSLSVYDGSSWTNSAAEGWDGDRWELWVRGEESVVLLATVWDSPDDAQEFASALPERDELRFKKVDDCVAIVAGPVRSKRAAVLLDRILAARPRPSD